MLSKTAFTAIVSVIGLCGILLWRVREGRTAVTARKLLIPPMGMATGFSMFFVPAFRFPLTWAIGAFLIGAIVLAWPLLATSSLRREGDAIMMKRSGAFFAVVIVLAAVRYFARGYFEAYLSLEQTGGLFFVLAFGMIVRWRLSLYLSYRALTSEPSLSDSPLPEEARN
jgi:membrane protein CcdC involved in cytochrome C biogenesis